MQSPALRICVRIALFPCIAFGSATLQAAPTPAFTVSVANVVLSATGQGSTPLTLNASTGYEGSVFVNCFATSPPPSAKLPYCAAGPAFVYQLTSGETVKSSIPFTPYAVPVPASLPRRPARVPPAMALAGVLLVSLGLRRRTRPWLVLPLLGAFTLAGLSGFCACGGNGNSVTSGTFPYTVTATDTSTNASQSISIMVTIP